MRVKRDCKQRYNLLYGEKNAQESSGKNTKAQWNYRDKLHQNIISGFEIHNIFWHDQTKI
jgi:hypothetical protein